MELVTVFSTLHSAEADFIHSQLEAAGFEATIGEEFSNLGLTPPTTAGGIRVMVPEGQAADARALLEKTVFSETGFAPPPQ
jgi:hypothetical protein